MMKKCLESLYVFMNEVDTTFTVLGVQITVSLFASVGTAMAASIASWIASLF